jgi:hypothetical protein
MRPNPQDTSAFYLANIYHVYANATASRPIILPTLSAPPQFSPPTYAVLVNTLWLLSLVISLTGALLAVLVQQWAQSYRQATQRRHKPRKRARIRSFYAEGIEKYRLPQVTRAVPTLIHISLILFFTGLQVFLFHVHFTVFKAMIAWLGLCVIAYAYITLIPIFCQDSPYHSPITSSVWLCVTGTLYAVYTLLKNIMSHDSLIFKWYDARYSRSHLSWQPLRGMQEEADETALRLAPDIDYRALSWMFGTLDEDDEFEQFFDALPRLCASEASSQTVFIEPNQETLYHALIGLMDRTFSSNLVSEVVRQRRILICTRAIEATAIIGPYWMLHRVLGAWHGFLGCIEFGLLAQNWSIAHPVTAFYAQCAVAVVISSVQEREERWSRLAKRQLNMSTSCLQSYLTHGDSVLLANVVLVIRRAIQIYSGSATRLRADLRGRLSMTLESICKLDITQTLPDLQHEFCSLWNQLIDNALNNDHHHVRDISMTMLKGTRRLYVTLHQGTSIPTMAFYSTTRDGDSILDAESLPKCTTDDHCPSQPVPELELDDPPPDIAGNTAHTATIATVPPTMPPVVSVLPSTIPIMRRPLASAARTLPFLVPTRFRMPPVIPHPHLHITPARRADVISSSTTGPSSFTSASSLGNNTIRQPNPISALVPSSGRSAQTRFITPIVEDAIVPQSSPNICRATLATPPRQAIGTLDRDDSQLPSTAGITSSISSHDQDDSS